MDRWLRRRRSASEYREYRATVEKLFRRRHPLGYHDRRGQPEPDVQNTSQSDLSTDGNLLFREHVHHAERSAGRVSDVLFRGPGILPIPPATGRPRAWLFLGAAVHVLAVSKAHGIAHAARA